MFAQKLKFERILIYIHRLSGIRVESLATALGIDRPVLQDGHLIHRLPIPNSPYDIVLTAGPPNTFLLEKEPEDTRFINFFHSIISLQGYQFC
uniref:Class I SAM-dependent methyltransferase n=1 Tax=Caenorhabditis tropicalis TaxID=1561998 RepID=A0A1I7U797_9PELO